MFSHLVKIMTQNLKLFPGKGWALYHYIPHMIMSKRNWNYYIHWQVKCGAYVQAPQVNYPESKNHLKKLDGICLYSAPTFQGGHQIMELYMGRFTKTPKLFRITITYVAIHTVEKWRRIRNLSHWKIYNRKRKDILFPNVNLAVVGHWKQI